MRAPAPEPGSSVRRRPSTYEFQLKHTPRVGTMLAERFRIEGFLAQGGTAEVYLARDTHQGALVCIKQLKQDAAAHPELRSRFLNEARAAASVQHPAVIRVLGVEEPAHDAPFMILEALRGESLGEYLRRHGTIPQSLGIVLLRQAARALAAAHRVGVVHRDVKPDNLFLVGHPDSPSALKVLDFGMAKLEDEIVSDESTSVLGTAQYMAPEQILVEPVDCRTDVYGLGVVMFRMFTGHLPFDVHSSTDLLRHQLFSPVPPASWLVEQLTDGLEAIIQRATRKHPENRFDSMEELSEALDALVGLGTPAPFYELRHRPDLYVPQTSRGRSVARHLAKEFGIYAVAPPPSARF